MTDLSTLLSGIKPTDGIYQATATEDWLQGRTIYGGLSAAFGVECSLDAFKDMPPLRTAQFAFIGPATGTLKITPSILRKGKSTVFVGVESEGEGGLATRSTLCFGATRKAAFNPSAVRCPDVPPPEECPPFPLAIEGLNFARHFERRTAAGNAPFTSKQQLTTTTWIRHLENRPPSTAAAALVLADAVLPAAMAFFDEYKPLSTMTWTVDMTSENLQNEAGWWLIEVRAEMLSGGYSTQTMLVWNFQRELVMVCRQYIAVFA